MSLYTSLYLYSILYFIKKGPCIGTVYDITSVIFHISLASLNYVNLLFSTVKSGELPKYFLRLQKSALALKQMKINVCYKQLRITCTAYLIWKMLTQICNFVIDYYIFYSVRLRIILFFVPKLSDNCMECFMICLLSNIKDELTYLNTQISEYNSKTQDIQFLNMLFKHFGEVLDILKTTNQIFNIYLFVKSTNTFIHAVYGMYFVLDIISNNNLTKLLVLQCVFWSISIYSGITMICFVCHLIEMEVGITIINM